MARLRRAAIVAIALSGIGGCTRPSDAAVETALEQAWRDDTLGMAVTAKLATAEQVRALRSVRNTRNAGLNAVEAWGGSVARGVAEEAVAMVAAAGIDLSSPSPNGRAVELLTARDWDVTNLTVLDRRRSGDDAVLRVRYDVSAMVGGARETVARDLTQPIRLQPGDGDWRLLL